MLFLRRLATWKSPRDSLKYQNARNSAEHFERSAPDPAQSVRNWDYRIRHLRAAEDIFGIRRRRLREPLAVVSLLLLILSSSSFLIISWSSEEAAARTTRWALKSVSWQCLRDCSVMSHKLMTSYTVIYVFFQTTCLSSERYVRQNSTLSQMPETGKQPRNTSRAVRISNLVIPRILCI